MRRRVGRGFLQAIPGQVFLCSQDENCAWLQDPGPLFESSYCENSVNGTLDYVWLKGERMVD